MQISVRAALAESSDMDQSILLCELYGIKFKSFCNVARLQRTGELQFPVGAERLKAQRRKRNIRRKNNSSVLPMGFDATASLLLPDQNLLDLLPASVRPDITRANQIFAAAEEQANQGE